MSTGPGMCRHAGKYPCTRHAPSIAEFVQALAAMVGLAMRRRSARSISPIPHVVRDIGQGAEQSVAQGRVFHLLVERPAHA